MFEELAGRAAIVTGASKGIGKATALELAKSGVSVVLAARTTAALEDLAAEIRREGGAAEAVSCDVAVYADVLAAIERCQSAFGRLDILINNAGIVDPIARLADSDPEAWVKAAGINYHGVYHGLRAALPVMAKQGSGTVVNVSSGAAVNPMEGWSQYCSAKAAALMLTRAADKEYGDQGVRVVGISPGTVATEMQVLIKASGVNPVSQLDPSAHIPPQWAGQAIAWLCTEAAAPFAGQDFSLKTEEGLRLVGLPT